MSSDRNSSGVGSVDSGTGVPFSILRLRPIALYGLLSSAPPFCGRLSCGSIKPRFALSWFFSFVQCEMRTSRACRGSSAPSSIGIRVRMHPLAFAESGWVWVGAGSRPAGLRTERAIPGLRRDAALLDRKNTRQGRRAAPFLSPWLVSAFRS